MNQKNISAVLGFAVVVLLGTTIYFATVDTWSNTNTQEIWQRMPQSPNSQTAIDQKVSQLQEIVYSNSQYGFKLTFPQTWKEYIAKNRTINWGSFNADSVDFGLPMQDSLFNVSIYTKSQWQQIQSEESPRPKYLGENSQYVFGYSGAQDIVNDTMLARMREIPDIIKTFTLQEQNIYSEWEIYANDKYGFEIKYPSDWRYTQEERDFFSWGTGPKNQLHDITWGINVYSKPEYSFQKVVDSIGRQFSPDKRTVEVSDTIINDIDAKKIIVKNIQDADWYYVGIIIETNDKIYQISNGAVKDPKFEIFYNSFSFKNSK